MSFYNGHEKTGFVGRHLSNLKGHALTPEGGEIPLPAQCKLGRPWQVPFVLSHGLPRKLAVSAWIASTAGTA